MLLRGLLRKADLGLVFVIELGSEGLHLAALEVRDPDRSPALGGSGYGGEHELEEAFWPKPLGMILRRRRSSRNKRSRRFVSGMKSAVSCDPGHSAK